MSIKIQQCTSKIIPGLLTPDECERIKSYIRTLETKPAQVTNAQSSKNITKKQYRKSDVSWLEPHPEINWAAHRIEEAMRTVNAEMYQFNLQALEQIQYLKYKRFGFFKPHFDTGSPSTAHRKLTLSVQLNAASDYTGGTLTVRDTGGTTQASKKQGDAIIFPTYLLHHAHTIYTGKRECLVAWMGSERPFA